MLTLSKVTPGKKAVNASRPELVLTPTFNKFTLNGMATEVMEIESGQTVEIHEDREVDSLDGRFYIAKGGVNGAKAVSASKTPGIGNSLSFNYAGLYSRMLQEDPNAYEVSAASLVEKDLVHERETKSGATSHTALKTIRFGLGEPVEAEVDGEELTLYPLIDVKVEPYSPKNIGGELEEE